ncbi:hypothetical protein BH11BAC2_BH11BAC2_10930 [soil metagenome]
MPNIKTFKRIVILFLSIIILVAIAQLSFTLVLDDKIKDYLVKEVKSGSKSLYHLEISKLQVNIFRQSVLFKGITINPVDSNSRHASYYASADVIKISDIAIWQYLLHRNIFSSKIEFTNPSASIYRGSQKVVKDSLDNDRFSIYRLLLPAVRSVEISSIVIHNASIKVFDNISDLLPVLGSDENELRIIKLKIDKEAEEGKRWFNAKELAISINNVDYSTKDSLYTFKIRSLNASYLDSTLSFDALKMTPNYSKMNFGNMAGKQIDRIKVSVEELQFDQMDIKAFFETGNFIAKSTKLKKPLVEAFRDKNDKRKPWHPESLQNLIKSIPVSTNIDSLFVEDGQVVYEEVAPGARKAGRIFFKKMNGSITGISNDSLNYTASSKIIVNVTAKLMDVAKIKVYLSIPLNTNQMVFDCSGHLSSMHLKELNDMTEENAGVSIRGGELDSMSFSFKADQIRATGKMIFAYHDLDFSIKNKKTGKSGFKEDALSWVARNFIVKKSNPTTGEDLRITSINYERNPSRFMFNYTFKALMSGIKPALGVKSRQKEEQD